MKATELLKKQHREVKALFRQAKKAEPEGRREILDEIEEKLTHHMHIEEEVFYPAVRELETKKTEEMIPEAYEEHHVVTLVLAEFPDLDPEDERFEAKMTVLDELIEHHVEEEEKEMFKAAEKLGDERLNELGAEMERMTAEAEEGEAPSQPAACASQCDAPRLTGPPLHPGHKANGCHLDEAAAVRVFSVPLSHDAKLSGRVSSG
jgi:hemerythrin-like domain-containing protein